MTEGHTEGDARSIPLISAKEKQSSECQMLIRKYSEIIVLAL